MSSEGSTDELNASELGTKQHWDTVYDAELQTFVECGDEGEVWFGRSTSQRILKYLNALDPIMKDSAIIDVGCGNGMLLIDLWQSGFRNLLGIDYSPNAVSLASSVAKSKGCLARFEVHNIVDWKGPTLIFKIVLDKGTYDAVSLDPAGALNKRKAYIENVNKLLTPGGVFIITTCNWTEKEIIEQFSKGMKHKETLPSPEFTFGGKLGKNVTTVVLEKLS